MIFLLLDLFALEEAPHFPCGLPHHKSLRRDLHDVLNLPAPVPRQAFFQHLDRLELLIVGGVGHEENVELCEEDFVGDVVTRLDLVDELHVEANLQHDLDEELLGLLSRDFRVLFLFVGLPIHPALDLEELGTKPIPWLSLVS